MLNNLKFNKLLLIFEELIRSTLYKVNKGFMKLEKLTIEVLKKLKQNGYNILIYNKKVSDQSIIWFPEIVENVYDHILNLCGLGMILYDEPNVLVIDNVLQSPEEYSLVGEVLV